MARAIKKPELYKWYEYPINYPASPGRYEIARSDDPKTIAAEYTGSWWGLNGKKIDTVTFWKRLKAGL